MKRKMLLLVILQRKIIETTRNNQDDNKSNNRILFTEKRFLTDQCSLSVKETWNYNNFSIGDSDTD